MPNKTQRRRPEARTSKTLLQNGKRSGNGGTRPSQEPATATSGQARDVTTAPPAWPKDVIFLPSHSQASTRLQARLAHQLCVAPRTTHPCHPFTVRAQGWTVVKPITIDTPCREPYIAPQSSYDVGNEYCETHREQAPKPAKKEPYRHPALGQCGLFARRDIPPRTLVVPYLGRAHLATLEDEDPESCYDAAIEVDGVRCGLDATEMGSEARFVNDYRGILERANLFFDDWKAPFPRDVVVPVTWDKGLKSQEAASEARDETSLEKRKGLNDSDGHERQSLCVEPCEPPLHVCGLALFSGAHTIKAGTELCASYGKGWWAARRQQASAEQN